MPAQLREPVKPQYSKSLKQGLAILLEELRMAQQWDRPAILIALCKNHLRLNQARKAVKKQLPEVVEINAEDFGERLALHVANHPKRGDAIFFIYNIAQTGVDGGDVFRSLNMHREYFVENKIRVVFWLGEVEANELPRRAIDFWAFRHRVVEFTVGRLPRKSMPMGAFITDQSKFVSRALHEYERGQTDLAVSILENAIRLNESNPVLWANAALFEHALGRNQAAHQKMAWALSIEPEDARLWLGAGYLNLSAGLLDEAQVCFQKAGAHYALAVCLFLLHQKKQSSEILRRIEKKSGDHHIFEDFILRGENPELKRPHSNPALEFLLEGIERMR